MEQGQKKGDQYEQANHRPCYGYDFPPSHSRHSRCSDKPAADTASLTSGYTRSTERRLYI